MIIITRSNSIYSSPRIEKYISFFDTNKINYQAIGWDRNCENLSRNRTIFFKKNSGYNIGGLNAVKLRVSWMIYLLKYFYKNKNKIKIIHAFDLDTAFPACIFKFTSNSKVKVIFDVCDWFSDTLYNQNKFILFCFRVMERFTIHNSDEVIICEPERIEQIPYKLKHKEITVPNIPSFDDTSFLHINQKFLFENDKLVISYVGGFSEFRMLNELLDVAERGLINLLIAGYGNKEIENRCIKASCLSNIKYFGKVSYKDGLNIMFNSHLIYAMYSKSNPNHFYAAPNKYYEAMMLGKPILTTKDIKLASKVEKNKIGFAINESLTELENFILNVDQPDLLEKGKAAFILWEKKYKSYTSDFMYNEYIKIINHNHI